MQYFKPDNDFFVGDCMPFYHAGTFRLFYLLDENHHGALGGLGGHQWAQASSRDLVRWDHHPLAIPLTTRNPRLESSQASSLATTSPLLLERLDPTTHIAGRAAAPILPL